MLRARFALPLLTAALFLAGCPFHTTGSIDGSGGSGGAGSSSSSTSSSTSSSSSSTSSSSSSGTGGMPVCGPTDTMQCYTGPGGTEGVGECKSGQAKCKADGSGYDACTGDTTPQPEDCVKAKDADCDNIVTMCTGDGIWADVGGGVGSDRAYGVTFDSKGNVIVVGAFQVAFTFSSNGSSLPGVANDDLFIAKYDPAGALLWSKGLGAAGDDVATSVAVDAQDNIFVTGYFTTALAFGGTATPLASAGGNDVFVAKLDPATGNGIWARSFGSIGADQRANELAVDNAGDVVVVGGFKGTLVFAGTMLQATGGDLDGFVAKLSGVDGNPLWSNAVSDGTVTGTQQLLGVAVDGAKNVIVVGNGDGNVNFGGGPVTGSIGLNVLIAKYAPNGALQWAKVPDGTGIDQAGNAVAADAAGNIYITGVFDQTLVLSASKTLTAVGAKDVFLAKLDPGGNLAWANQYGGTTGTDFGMGVAVDPFGNVLFCGYFNNKLDVGVPSALNANGYDIFIVKADPDGKTVWVQQQGTPGNDYPYSIAVTGAQKPGTIAVAGLAEGNITLANKPFMTHGGQDAYVTVLNP